MNAFLTAPAPVDTWRQAVLARAARGDRFVGLYTSGQTENCRMTALFAGRAGVERVVTPVPASTSAPVGDGAPANGSAPQYPALTPDIPAAEWYERAIRDLSDVRPVGHPRLDPLLRPRTGDEQPGTVEVGGPGMFTVAYGPVRSGVSESIEFLVETPGENIPLVTIRPYFKHRGVATRFESMTVDAGVLLAERVEGIASVAHALAYCRAVETLAGTEISRAAGLTRVIFAELERIANHLDVVTRLADGAGLAVAVARFGWHKEMVMRLVSHLCGSRFGRNVVIPGGVNPRLRLDPGDVTAHITAIAGRLAGDVRALMASASFLDRLRGTGVLAADFARSYGALGPIGRASGCDNDARRAWPYDGYRSLPPPALPDVDSCDAVGRLRVRLAEVDAAVELIVGAAAQLEAAGTAGANLGPVRASTDAAVASGEAVGWAEAPQGEVVYALDVADGHLTRCFARSASFHNLPLFEHVWHGDVKTDFAFIEASFGLSYAAVAM